ncbi:MAG: hypothetical protein VXY56_13430 [Pseudomonadota bacterium]|nr:hypothetical protein [Pseudomonadota bacterium]
MQSSQWQLLQTYANQTTLQLAANTLQQQKIEVFVEPDQPIVGLDLGGRLYVRPDMSLLAEQILQGSRITDAELEALALAGEVPKDV